MKESINLSFGRAKVSITANVCVSLQLLYTMLCTRADLKIEQETALIVVNYIGIVNLITVVQNELIVIVAVSYQHYMEYVASVLKGMVHNGCKYKTFIKLNLNWKIEYK